MFTWLNNLFPYSDLHSLNLDWILSKMKETAAQAAKAIADSANALSQVIEAKTAAQNAQTAAQDAQTAANTAAGNAASAAANAVQALNAAQSAQSAAQTAQSTAETAQSTAETAQNTANTAQSAAQNAQNVAQTANTAANNALSKFPVTAEDIADNAVTVKKIADDAITVDKIGTRAVTSVKIANGAVTNEKLANNSFYAAFGSYSRLQAKTAAELNESGGSFSFKRTATRAVLFVASGYTSYTSESVRHNMNIYSAPFILQTNDLKLNIPVILSDYNTTTKENTNYNGSLTITISNGGVDVDGLITFSDPLPPLDSSIAIQYGIVSIGARPD